MPRTCCSSRRRSSAASPRRPAPGGGTPLASASELLISATATTGQTSAQHFVYNTASGILYYDATGTGASIAVAQLGTTSHPAISYTDIHIIA